MVSTVLQDTDGQFIGLSVAEDLAFALENDMVDLGTMKERVQSSSHPTVEDLTAVAHISD